jgi:hypothetical protein
MANLGTELLTGVPFPASQAIYSSEEVTADTLKQGVLPTWSVAWFL